MSDLRVGAAWCGSIETLRDYKNIPATTLHDFVMYCLEGRVGGHFVRAVITDSLSLAFQYADLGNIKGLWALATWVYNRAPKQAFGSPQQLEMWRQMGGLRGWYQGPEDVRKELLMEWYTTAVKDTLLEGMVVHV